MSFEGKREKERMYVLVQATVSLKTDIPLQKYCTGIIKAKSFLSGQCGYYAAEASGTTRNAPGGLLADFLPLPLPPPASPFPNSPPLLPRAIYRNRPKG